MRVTRLEIFGFKSFMERLLLPLGQGVTGVVGPNGCGKSNVVDALRWVLGESRARELRGGTLEDVIFNGTDRLRPLGLAEVTITLRASEDDLFSDIVSPELEALRVLESVTAPAEAPDDAPPTEEAPHDGPTVDGAPEGGSSDEASAADGAPAPVEESAPVEEPGPAEKPVPAAPTLADRFSWLRNVSEVQVTRRLYRSGESEFFINKVPCRLKDMKDLFRAVGLGARAYTIVAQGEVSRIVTAKPEDRRLILEEAAGVLGFRDKIAEAGRRLAETTVSVTRLDDVIRELSRQVGSLKRQASRARARLELKSELSSIDRALFLETYRSLSERFEAVTAARASCDEAEAAAGADLARAESDEETARSGVSAVDERAAEIRIRADRLREEIHRRSRHRAERTAKLNELRSLLSARENEVRRLGDREAELTRRRSALVASTAAAEEEARRLEEEAAEYDVSALESEGAEVSSYLAARRSELKPAEDAVRAARDALIADRSSLASVREQVAAASPLAQLGQTLGSDVLADLPEDVRLFVDGLAVPDDKAKAVQSLLAERARFLLSSTPHAVGRHFVRYIEARRDSERRGLGIGVFRRGPAPAPAPARDVPFTPVLGAIKIAEEHALAASHVFGNAYFADDVESALAYFEGEGARPDVVLATPEGDLVTAFSFYSLRHEGGLLVLRAKEKTLAERVSVLVSAEEEAVAAKERLVMSIQGAEKRQEEIRAEVRRREEFLRDFVRAQGSVRGRLESDRRALAETDADVARLAATVEECRERIDEVREQAADVEEEVAVLSEQGEDPAVPELESLVAEEQETAAARRACRRAVDEASEAAARAREALEEVRRRSGQFLVELRTIEVEHRSLRERAEETFGEGGYEGLAADASAEEPPPRSDADTVRALKTRAAEIRARIAREGDVDPTAVERYDEENARLEGLVSQKVDLETAAETLRLSIERLTKTSEARFLETYAAVCRNFAALVPRLFGGGHGELKLLDPEAPLKSGVDIVVRPPGKKPKSIELLSGGEKALCATALVVSMFLERPSPLCVLDEVDAPLDEANLIRFLSLVREMSARTQFLMITHNKRSMAIADTLVGVTMQQPGASKLVTVNLQEAEAKVA